MSQAKTEQGPKVPVEYAAIVGRQGGKGIFGIEGAAEEVARQAKLAALQWQRTHDRSFSIRAIHSGQEWRTHSFYCQCRGGDTPKLAEKSPTVQFSFRHCPAFPLLQV